MRSVMGVLASLGAVLVVGLASVASASVAGTSIAIRFGADWQMPATEVAGVTGVETARWNNTGPGAITGATGTQSNLVVDSFGVGSSSTASATWSAQDVGENNAEGFASGTGNHHLMWGYLKNASTSSDSTITISDLPASFTGGYDVYVYTSNNENVTGRLSSYTVNGNTKTAAGLVGDDSSSFVEAVGSTPGNYLHFTGLSGSSVEILFRAAGDPQGLGAVHGVEIVAVPEPVSTSLLCAGAVALAVRRRRRVA